MQSSQPFSQDIDLYSRGLFFSPAVAFAIFILLILALLYDQTELVVFSVIILFMSLVLKLWSRHSVRDLVYDIQLDKDQVFPGEEIDFKVIIANNKWLPVHAKIRLAIDSSLTEEKEGLRLKEDSGILWRQRIEYQRNLSPRKRGIYNTGSPRLITGDFFGFFPRQTGQVNNADITVFPRLVHLKPFPILSKLILGKSSSLSPIHDPVFIMGTRDYQSHSPGRNIHWKASARLNQLQEKIFEPTEQENITIILDSSGFFDKTDDGGFERSIEAIASLGIELEKRSYAFGFATNSQLNRAGGASLVPARNSLQIQSLLKILANLKFADPLSIEPLFADRALFPIGVTCICFSCSPIRHDHPVTDLKTPLVNIISNSESAANSGSKSEPVARTYSLDDIIQND